MLNSRYSVVVVAAALAMLLSGLIEGVRVSHSDMAKGVSSSAQSDIVLHQRVECDASGLEESCCQVSQCVSCYTMPSQIPSTSSFHSGIVTTDQLDPRLQVVNQPQFKPPRIS